MANMTYKEAMDVLRNPDKNMKIWEDTVVIMTSAYAKAIELALEALEKVAKIAPVGDVHPDWYDRLSVLDYEYHPEPDGEPWYHARDVWAAIERCDNGKESNP